MNIKNIKLDSKISVAKQKALAINIKKYFSGDANAGAICAKLGKEELDGSELLRNLLTLSETTVLEYDNKVKCISIICDFDTEEVETETEEVETETEEVETETEEVETETVEEVKIKITSVEGVKGKSVKFLENVLGYNKRSAKQFVNDLDSELLILKSLLEDAPFEYTIVE